MQLAPIPFDDGERLAELTGLGSPALPRMNSWIG